ncbi:DJ-1/PfpI family protein [Tenggerimyces flavus]|uniref:DJ-1/PfpI family protein n=1 Tax=Tenggerimyces flavus TaxID=1708749 RepID=A0ABV7Y5M4_9ACTN|nr:DJ-1/PfpI family protein [Tenggerimyces flavus]MBM7785006.1 transcriptional regulator GlxA family with amidase domain [Tenggerimyces flavus]
MKRWLVRAATGLSIGVAALAAITGAGWTTAADAIGAVYPAPVALTDQVETAVEQAPIPTHDPTRPTAVILLGNQGANVVDAMAPYATLKESKAFNVYTVAPTRRPVPLNGGLDLVPDLSFEDLKQKVPLGADVIVVPAVPDPKKPVSEPLKNWLHEQATAGATLVGVCVGTELIADIGLLDGRPATSHWFGLTPLTHDYKQIEWIRGPRYVDDGDIITTAGVLSGIDGALRVIERYAGEATARQAADAVRWPNYSPGKPGPAPESTLALTDLATPINLAFRTPTQLGVLLTEGVGEIELSSILRPYTERSFIARPLPLTLDGQPIRSRHGLTFVPRSTLAAAGQLDRLIVPGEAAAAAADPAIAQAASAAGLTAEYVHTRGGFPFDDGLRDLAAHSDLASARWTAKVLEYAAPADLSGPAWPWMPTLRLLLVALAGALIAAGIVWVLRRWPGFRRFTGHYLEMVVSMLAGMMLLDPVWTAVFRGLSENVVASTLVMAANMTIGMGLWMWLRGHGWRMIGEMSVAMVAPFVLLLVPTLLGLLTGNELMMIGHVAMFVTMLIPMLARRHHYSAKRGGGPFRWSRRRQPAEQPVRQEVLESVGSR